MTIDNKHKVPKKVWKRWPESARKMFNSLYETILKNQPIFIHPKTTIINQNLWSTTAWNCAWMAAEEVAYQEEQFND